MGSYQINPVNKFGGSLRIPGDKSVSHRGLLFGALAQGTTLVRHILKSGDVLSTAQCLKDMGVKIEIGETLTKVQGVGVQGLKAPSRVLDCGNSGTTMRLLMGVLSGQRFECELTGDDSLTKRPMKRVAEPLRQMGARFELTRNDFAPLKISGGPLKGINYELPVASAQIKSAILLAGLLAQGETKLTGKIVSRDHTERLLPHFGAQVRLTRESVSIQGGQKLNGSEVLVPGDPSTAAFWMAAALMIPGSNLSLLDIGLNPSRTGFIKVVQRMGASLQIGMTQEKPEPIGTLKLSHSQLQGVNISPEEVPSLIDEIPILAILATQAHGRTEIRGAEELRVKESDRLEAVAQNLKAMGAQIETLPDGLIINGPQKLKGATIESFHDHRIAMAFSVAGLIAQGSTEILNSECVGISYPNFYIHLKELTR